MLQNLWARGNPTPACWLGEESEATVAHPRWMVPCRQQALAHLRTKATQGTPECGTGEMRALH